MRSHRYLVIAAVALAAVVAFLAFEFVTAPRIEAVSPRPDAFLKDDSVRVSIDLRGADTLSDLSILLDDKDVTPNVRVSGSRLYFDSNRLSEGEHVVALQAQTPNLLRPTVHKTWSFVVDTIPPQIALATPRRGAAVTTRPVVLRGTTEAAAVVKVEVAFDRAERSSATEIAADKGIVVFSTPSSATASPQPSTTSTARTSASPGSGAASATATAGTDTSPDSGAASVSPTPGPSRTPVAPTTSAQATAAADGSFAIPLTLPDGPAAVHVVATDGAGNSSASDISFLVDAEPPELVVAGAPPVVKDGRPRLMVIATDRAGAPRVRVRLDGEIVFDKSLNGQTALPVKTLAEGRHTLLVTATDRGDNVTSDDREFLVNSTEKLGKATLIAGAKGRDVRDLQRLLAGQRFFKGKRTGVYDRATTRAVERLQASLGMAPDGVAGPQVLAALRGRIVIDQSEHRLFFYLDGKLRKTYAVATGQPAWPTPNGTFYVQWMTKNPTWTPPDSPWAAGASPIGPGPNNPVGMRWIGTSYPGVGIHGVPPSEDSSIGTFASHGCIRMHEWDVEQLYEWVTVGMTIVIRP